MIGSLHFSESLAEFFVQPEICMCSDNLYFEKLQKRPINIVTW